MTTFVLVHGLGGTGATMEPLADLLQDAGHHPVLITLPGHGLEPESLLDVAWAHWVDAVLDTLPYEGAVVIGQSMGGTLALAAAAVDHRVAGVAAVNAPPPDPDAIDGLEWRQSKGHDWVDGPELGDGEAHRQCCRHEPAGRRAGERATGRHGLRLGEGTNGSPPLG